MLITPERRDELRRVHKALYAAVERLVGNWRGVAEEWRLGPKEWDILSEQARHPFRAGTWRPDYIIAEDGSLHLCEITSRFFAHGIFMSWFGDRFNRQFMERLPSITWDSRFTEMMEYMMRLTGGRDRIYVFKSADKSGEIRLYKRFYEANGIRVTVLETAEVEARRDEWSDGACLISALNQKDILSFSDRTLQAMIEGGMISDFRNIFLLHDKRFMTLWFKDAFNVVPDIEFLRSHAIPTWDTTDPAAAERIQDAEANREDYIFKPFRLGKSEGLMPGPMTTPECWQSFWKSRPEGILQPFIRQRTFPTVWEGTPFDDYLCGMMLCIDDRYFDSGYFRCSSLPVTNLGDDRKAASLHSASPQLAEYCDVL